MLPAESAGESMSSASPCLAPPGLISQQLQDYTRQAAVQVKGLLDKNNLPTDLQLHRYMRELVRHLELLITEAPQGLRREVARPFGGLWDFEGNTALRSVPLRVEHLVYVLGELQALLNAGQEVMREVAVREIGQEVRRLIASTPFWRVDRELLRRFERGKQRKEFASGPAGFLSVGCRCTSCSSWHQTRAIMSFRGSSGTATVMWRSPCFIGMRSSIMVTHLEMMALSTMRGKTPSIMTVTLICLWDLMRERGRSTSTEEA